LQQPDRVSRGRGVEDNVIEFCGKPRIRDAKLNANPSQFRRWQIIAGGTFLMLFGLALGVMLTKSVRPRESEKLMRP
jgi:hypothetical protein